MTICDVDGLQARFRGVMAHVATPGIGRHRDGGNDLLVQGTVVTAQTLTGQPSTHRSRALGVHAAMDARL